MEAVTGGSDAALIGGVLRTIGDVLLI